MNARTNQSRAESLLESVRPDLLKLLENAPPYGSCGLEIVFHDDEIARLVIKAEVSRKPRTGGRI